MYLKTLAVLGGGDQSIAATVVAERLGVTPVAANEMLRRLIGESLVGHEQRRGFRLTAEGRRAAWDVIRRQRLWERFLVDRLGLDPARAAGWACLLEHATAPEVLDALDGFLGFPETSPQGQPIPRSPGDPVRQDGRSLADVDLGEAVRLLAFDDEDPEVLDYLYRVGLTVGTVVRVADVGPRRSLFTLEGPSGTVVVGREVAATIRTAAATTPAGPVGTPPRPEVARDGTGREAGELVL
jgi:DtxR family Mn-dependent transcriptional regulator